MKARIAIIGDYEAESKTYGVGLIADESEVEKSPLKEGDEVEIVLIVNAPRNAEEQLVRQALGYLRGLVDILGPCDHFDHHGYCQTHFIESPCRVGKAREFLESLPNDKHESRASRAPSSCSASGGKK
jgi:hypothetical protein